MSADAPNHDAEQPQSKRAETGQEKRPARVKAGLPRSIRLLKHADFERVYKQGSRHFSSHMTVFYWRQETGPARVGFTVGRILGGAVDRNRIKRRLREAVRLRHALLAGPVDIVINPKKSVLRVEFGTLLDEIDRAFNLISRKLAPVQDGRKKT